MLTISAALKIAGEHHAAGGLDMAEEICRRVLQAEPSHFEALHLLGVIAAGEGRHEAAIEYLGRAIALKGSEAAFHNELAKALRNLGKLEKAVAAHHRALQLKPDFAEAHSHLGDTYCQRGRLEEAVACYRRALELKPDLAEAHNNLGNALTDQGKTDEAVACYRRAVELEPNSAEAQNNLGNGLSDQGRLDEAVACYRRALQRKPHLARTHGNLGNALRRQGKLGQAVACYQRALQLEPDHAEAHTNLGTALLDQGRVEEAVACHWRALELKPDLADAHNNLASAFQRQGKLEEAVASYRRAVALKPDLADAHSNLGAALKGQGKLDEAVACYRRALELKPDFADAHSNLLLALQYRAGATPAGLAAAHAEYERRYAAPLRATWRPHANARDPGRRLRLGLVSPDFGRHPVGYFLVRSLESLDRGQCEAVCYCNQAIEDDLTARCRAAAAIWRDVAGANDEQLAEQIRADGIDILFDLAGHTGHNRLLVFARRPAPIQITWIGYEGTTGLAAMDYILADRHVVAEGSEHDYRERVLRMPDDYLCYDPPAAAPPVGSPPAIRRGHATFGSFNNPAKITAEVVRVWAEILRRAPSARLVMKYQGLGDPALQQRYRDLFAACGVKPERLQLLPASAYAEYLAAYHDVDVALDPFPFSGNATTCDALWMGVPVVTCPGATFASRHGLSHLRTIGLKETIAGNPDEYVEIAVGLAGDLARLAELRAGLRPRVARSPLCDGDRFAANLTDLLRSVWRCWCGGWEGR